MQEYKVRYKNSNFSNEKVELDGKSFVHCEFENCIIILEKGETELSGSSFKNCKLMLRGSAYTIGKIIKLFTGKSPLKVLDMEEPLFEKGEHSNATSLRGHPKGFTVHQVKKDDQR